ncbi:MAG TPA: hypothetical protein VEL75_20895 [Candidatus Methylomirabilis sp.]|nr:hypothetical protein [Candidatus Methylomirabilis sp.]
MTPHRIDFCRRCAACRKGRRETLAKAERSHAGRFAKGMHLIAGKDPADAI